MWKVGTSTGKQRYKCKNCGKSQSDVDNRVKYSDKERGRALVLYLKSCGSCKIARIMKEFFGKEYRYQTIVNWVKRAGMKDMHEEKSRGKIDALEIYITEFELDPWRRIGNKKRSVLGSSIALFLKARTRSR